MNYIRCCSMGFRILVLAVWIATLPAMRLFAQNPVVAAQQEDRFAKLANRLEAMAFTDVPGLDETANLAVGNASIQEFIRGIAATHNLNVAIDPTLSLRVSNNFTNVRVRDLLVFLAREYDLDIRITGNIIALSKYVAPPVNKVVPEPKKILVNYNAQRELLTADLRNDTLMAVVRQITQLTKQNVVLAPGLSTKTVSGYLEDLPLSQALDKLAYANGLKLLRPDNQSYVLQPTDATESTSRSSRRSENGGDGTLSNPKRRASSGNAAVEVRKGRAGGNLISIDAENVPIAQLLNDVSQDAGVNYVLFSEIAGNTTVRVRDVTYPEFLNFLLQGTTHTYRLLDSIYAIGGRGLEGLRNTKVVKLQYRPAEKIDEVIPTELKKGVEIKVFKELNSIILSGSSPQIAEIKEFLKSIDQPVVNVMIDVMVVELRRGHSDKAGIQAFLGDSTVKTGGSVFPGLDMTISSGSINSFLSKLGANGLVNIGKITPNFYVTLQALEQNNYLNLRSTPKLATLNGHEATLKIGQSVYYVEENQVISGGVTPIVNRTQVFKQVSADLTIKINPMVSGDNSITLEIDAGFSDFINPTIARAPPGNATRQFTSMIKVKNEEMIVLGGLEEVRRAHSGSGTPFLSRIPIVKWFFSTRNDEKRNNKLLIFIKPTIVY